MSNCLKCGNSDTTCKDSRPSNYDTQPAIRRRRHCDKCKFKYTTYELTEEYLREGGVRITKIQKIEELIRQVYATIKE